MPSPWPPSTGTGQPSREVDWESGAVDLVREPVSWPETGRPRRAAVSSFGISGTNAHVIIEQFSGDAPPNEGEPVITTPTVPWVLSGKSPAALTAQAARLLGHLEGEEHFDPGAVGHSLALGRARFEHRAVVVANELTEFRAALAALSAGATHDAVVTGAAMVSEANAVFVFRDRPEEWLATTSDLLAASPVFATRFEECAAALAEHADWSLQDVSRFRADAPEPTRPDVARSGQWAAMVSLAEVWRACGVRPVSVAGDGVGAVAAAVVAGGLDLAEAARLVVAGENAVSTTGSDIPVHSLDQAVDGVPVRVDPGQRPESFWFALAEAHTRGVAVDWTAVFTGEGPRVVDLPTYAFQRQRYWLKATNGRGQDVTAAGLRAVNHPMIVSEVGLAGGDGVVLTGLLSGETHPWIGEHTISGSALLPGTAFVELALAAAERVGYALLDELTIEAPLVLPAGTAVTVQVAVSGEDESGRRTVAVYSAPAEGDEDLWTRHASGSLALSARAVTEELSVWPPEGAAPIEVEDLYESLARGGYEYGPVFQGLRRAWRLGEDEVFAEVALPVDVAVDGFGVHPALLDAALHGIGLFGQDTVSLPFAWSGVSVFAVGATTARVRISRAGSGFSLLLADGVGQPVAAGVGWGVRAGCPG
ncbi:hypothetical protein C1701_25785 [Actinoalloteichus sp. AHMU CJ021]|nr:hypothetical protein C1701_25785 [Actinoalloteichus sp. AHMU CJ021]